MYFFFYIYLDNVAKLLRFIKKKTYACISSFREQDIVNSYYKNVYIKPYCRIGPYIVGILVGYMLLHKKELILKKVLFFNNI